MVAVGSLLAAAAGEQPGLCSARQQRPCLQQAEGIAADSNGGMRSSGRSRRGSSSSMV